MLSGPYSPWNTFATKAGPERQSENAGVPELH
jgi:hypothetical protein